MPLFKKKNDSLDRRRAVRQEMPVAQDARKRKINKILIILLIIFIILMAGFIWLLIKNNYFDVQDISIEGVKYDQSIVPVDEKNLLDLAEELRTRKDSFFSGKNSLLAIKEYKIKKEILKQQSFQKIKIIRRFPHRLVVKYWEIQPMAILQPYGDFSYCLDPVIGFAALHQTPQTTSLPIIIDHTVLPLNKNFFDLMSQLINKINALSVNPGIKIKIAQIDYRNNILQIKITTNEDWQIYLLGDSTLNYQIYKLQEGLTKYIEDRSELEYLDLRFKDAIYYKEKNT
ncbi:MAG: hypothetical protein AAB465_03045 [Patescibacteria group bacterium]